MGNTFEIRIRDLPIPESVTEYDYTQTRLYVCMADTDRDAPRMIKGYYFVGEYRLSVVHPVRGMKAVMLGGGRWGCNSFPGRSMQILHCESLPEFTEIEDVPMPKRFKNLEWRNGSWGRWKPTRKWEIVT